MYSSKGDQISHLCSWPLSLSTGSELLLKLQICEISSYFMGISNKMKGSINTYKAYYNVLTLSSVRTPYMENNSARFRTLHHFCADWYSAPDLCLSWTRAHSICTVIPVPWCCVALGDIITTEEGFISHNIRALILFYSSESLLAASVLLRLPEDNNLITHRRHDPGFALNYLIHSY